MAIQDPEIDRQHCAAIVHEYHRCKDAFDAFASAAEQIITQGQTREKSYRCYNAYSDFILHLYEFLIALHARDLGVTKINDGYGKKKFERLDMFIQATATRIVENRIFCIEKGVAPTWENHVSHYQKLLPVPPYFASNFRNMRNKVSGHVTYERIKEINLTSFYEANHGYLYLMFRDCGDWWANKGNEFPELEQITDFFGAISRELRNSEALPP